MAGNATINSGPYNYTPKNTAYPGQYNRTISVTSLPYYATSSFNVNPIAFILSATSSIAQTTGDPNIVFTLINGGTITGAALTVGTLNQYSIYSITGTLGVNVITLMYQE